MKAFLYNLVLWISFGLVCCDRQRANWSARDGDRIGTVEFRFEGKTDIDPARVRNLIKLTDGSSYSGAAVDHDIFTLYESGEFDDVKVHAEPADGGIRLIFVVTLRPQLGPPFSIGNTAISNRRLVEASGLTKDESITVDVLETARQKIKAYYVDRGYTDAEVVCRAWAGDNPTPEDYVFEINEGRLNPRASSQKEEGKQAGTGQPAARPESNPGGVPKNLNLKRKSAPGSGSQTSSL